MTGKGGELVVLCPELSGVDRPFPAFPTVSHRFRKRYALPFPGRCFGAGAEPTRETVHVQVDHESAFPEAVKGLGK